MTEECSGLAQGVWPQQSCSKQHAVCTWLETCNCMLLLNLPFSSFSCYVPEESFQLHRKKNNPANRQRQPSRLLRYHGAVEGVLLLLLLPFDGRVSGKKHFLPEGLPGLLTRTLTPTVTTLYSLPDQHTQATLGGCWGTWTGGFLFFLFFLNLFNFSLLCGCRYKIIYDETLCERTEI